MAINQEKMMQSILDIIYDSLTTPPSGGMSGRPPVEPENTFVTLAFPGNPIDVSQFANAWSPTNPEGNTVASENFAWLVDNVPKRETIHSPSGLSVDDLYGEIVNANVAPQEDPDPASQKSYQEAYDFLHADGIDYNDLGQQVTVKVDSPVYRNYKRKKSAYSQALATFMTNFLQYDLSKTEDQRKWSFLGPALQAPVDLAWADLQKAQATRVEQALAVEAQHQRSSLAGIFASAAQHFNQTKKSSVLIGGTEVWHHSFPFPGNWFASSAADNFTLLTVTSNSYYSSSRSRFSSYSGRAGASWGLWSVGGGSSGQFQSHDSHRETENVSVSFKWGRVEIQRPWLNAALLSLSGWSVAGRAPGAFSTGTVDDNDGIFPLLPTSFIVARDIQISGNWGESDYHYAMRATEHNASGGWGPFRLSGSYSERSSSRTFRSQFDGTTISVPGIQIIAWINSVLPYSPPKK